MKSWISGMGGEKEKMFWIYFGINIWGDKRVWTQTHQLSLSSSFELLPWGVSRSWAPVLEQALKCRGHQSRRETEDLKLASRQQATNCPLKLQVSSGGPRGLDQMNELGLKSSWLSLLMRLDLVSRAKKGLQEIEASEWEMAWNWTTYTSAEFTVKSLYIHDLTFLVSLAQEDEIVFQECDRLRNDLVY